MADLELLRTLGDQVHPPAFDALADLATRPGGGGYWMLATDGTVWARGAATTFPGVVSLVPGERATGISPTPGGSGYWVFTDRGRVFPFGDAPDLGDAAGRSHVRVVDFAMLRD